MTALAEATRATALPAGDRQGHLLAAGDTWDFELRRQGERFPVTQDFYRARKVRR